VPLQTQHSAHAEGRYLRLCQCHWPSGIDNSRTWLRAECAACLRWKHMRCADSHRKLHTDKMLPAAWHMSASVWQRVHQAPTAAHCCTLCWSMHKVRMHIQPVTNEARGIPAWAACMIATGIC
jgi:hypothetical protein